SRSLRLGSEAAVDAARLTERLLSGATNYGANLWLGCQATGFRTIGGRINGVVTAQGVIAADQVVIAAGVATEALLAPLGMALPMLSRPGLMVCTRPLPPTIHHILVSPHGELRQDRSGRILAPTAAAHQGDATETITQLPGDAAKATMGMLRSLLPGVDLQLEVVKMAHRPVPADGLPVVGPLGIDGLYVATMHSGVTLAPLIATLVRDEVLLGEKAALLAPFRPQRLH
ncbi:MAG: FAD-binding oxidoreductase, partial [Paracoccaceae bacterium]